MGREGTLTGVFGVPGAGKGVVSSKLMYGFLRRGGVKRILTNAPLVEKYWPVPIKFYTNKEISMLSMGDLREGDIVFVDEAGNSVWDAVEWKKVKDETDVKDWVSQARKLGVDFLVVSQSFEEFVFFVRRKLVSSWMCWRFGPMRGARAFVVEGGKCQRPFGVPFFFLTWFPPARFVRCYDSRQLVGTGPGDEAASAVRRPRLRWLWVSVALAVAAVGARLAWSRWGVVPSIKKAIDSAKAAVVGVVPAAPTRGSGVKVLPSVNGEVYKREKGFFYDRGGNRIDPVVGLSKSGSVADWGFEWDTLQERNSTQGGGQPGRGAGAASSARGADVNIQRSDQALDVGGAGGRAGGPGYSGASESGVH